MKTYNVTVPEIAIVAATRARPPWTVPGERTVGASASQPRLAYARSPRFARGPLAAGSRGMAGAGAGLLLSDFLRPDTRRTLGWTLLAIGVLTTIPIAMALFGRRERPVSAD